MNSPWLSFCLILLAMALYGALHSLLATAGAKARARQWFGPAADRGYRLAYNIVGGVSLLPVLWLVAKLPDRSLYAIPWPWTLLTGAGQIIGALVVLLGVWQTGAARFLGLRQLVAPDTHQESPHLVISGLYRWVRHPLYAGGLLFIWLTPRLSVNLLALYLGLTLYILIGARLEERRLLAEFGEAYAQYQQNVPMLLPRPPRRNQRTHTPMN